MEDGLRKLDTMAHCAYYVPQGTHCTEEAALDYIAPIVMALTVALVVALVMRGRGDASGGADTAVTRERLRAAEQQNAELKTQLARAEEEAELQRAEREKAVHAALTQVGEWREKCSNLQTTLTKEQETSAEKLALLNEAQQQLSNTFKALAGSALETNRESFLQLAKDQFDKLQQAAQGDLTRRQQAIGELVKPLHENLTKVTGKIESIEKDRTTAFATLDEQLKNLALVQKGLESETRNLISALRQPAARGRWGEIQLKNVVKMAGMLEHCDFDQQDSVQTDDGRLRPDMVVRLPGGKNIVVDSKVALDAYLSAHQEPDESRRQEHLARHAVQVRKHMDNLGAQSYWKHLDPSPEFVVLFLPGEPFFSAALEQDPSLIERGVGKNVIVATPTTLIALLRAVAYGWQQDKLSRNAQEISNLGRELYDRVRIFVEKFAKLGRHLNTATNSYNEASRSLDGRLLVSIKRFNELGAGTNDEIETPPPVTTIGQTPQGLSLDAPEGEPSDDPNDDLDSPS